MSKNDQIYAIYMDELCTHCVSNNVETQRNMALYPLYPLQLL